MLKKQITVICDVTKETFVPTGENVTARVAMQQAKAAGWSELNVAGKDIHLAPTVNVSDLFKGIGLDLSAIPEKTTRSSNPSAPVAETDLIEFDDDDDDDSDDDEE